MYRNVLKQIFDFIFSLSALLLISPVFILVMISIALVNKGNPFFVQRRPGKDEKIFSIFKFKTMNDAVDEFGNLLPDTERLTRVGSFVRKTSLDELPQLINIIKGDMSFIGPRPLLVRYLPFYTEEENKRHTIKPGITGWAQVNGRNTLNWDRRLRLDVYYVDNVSLILDIKIILKTIQKVLQSKDIVVDPESVMQNLDDERKFRNSKS